MHRTSGAEYRTDVQYPAFFHREQAPSWTHAVLGALGRVPPADRACCEIGCGQGFGIALLAAANPATRFIGIDISAAHIERAQARAEAAKLANLDFICGDIRDPDLVSGRFGHILCHGMLSWVGDDVRAAVMGFVARHLGPDGVAVLHYMSEPGGAAFRAFHGVFRAALGQPDPVAAGLKLLQDMRQAQAGFFQLHGHAAFTLDALLRDDPAYVAHEYLNPEFRPLAFREVHDAATRVGLTWLGSATPVENIDALSLPGEAAKVVAPLRDLVLRETMKDLARNQAIRYDLIGHPAPPMTDAAHLALLRRTAWVLRPGAPRFGQQTRGITVSTRIGPVEVDARTLAPLLDRLRNGPATFAALEGIAPFTGRPGLLNQMLQLALDAGIVHPVAPIVDGAPAGRLNRVLLAEALTGGKVPALAAPALGSGLPVTRADIDALTNGTATAGFRRMFVLEA